MKLKAWLCLFLVLVLTALAFGQKTPSVDKYEELSYRLQTDWRAQDAGKNVVRLKSSVTQKAGPKLKDNGWLTRSLSRIKNLFGTPDIHKPTPPKIDPPDVGFMGAAMRVLLWVALIGGAALLLYLALRNVSFQGRKKRSKGTALVEESEPAYTANEWQQNALDAIGRGDYRTAVRCYYLGALVAMDEKRILRFIRWETNWEHLYRYEGGSRRIEGIDLRDLTRKFDRIWYGKVSCSQVDVEPFRAAFETARAAHREGAA